MPKKRKQDVSEHAGGSDKATFGAGCFWDVEETFRTTKGVVETAVGYSGGKAKNPTYEQVCSGTTGHAEVAQVKFNPKIISYEKLLDLFFKAHDPTQLNRQGPDVGEQYRSVIFYHSPAQKKVAEKVYEKYNKKYKGRVVTKIIKARTFYKAEEYHQKYVMKKKDTFLGRLLGK